jgi:threonine/homoserine/homoserine lactone efflux protein
LLAARRGYTEAFETDKKKATPRGAFVAGLLTNLLNPKVAVFFLALWPQFLPADASALDIAVLAGFAAAGPLCWFLLLANIVTVLRRYLVRANVRRVLDAVMGTVLVGLGVRVAVSQ